mgnify:CR=1 FL=1
MKGFKMDKTVFRLILSGVVLCILSGCASYYRVTDPRTEKVYYTTEIKKQSGGAIVIMDNKTAKKVTLQDSEIEKISKDAYNVGIYDR